MKIPLIKSLVILTASVALIISTYSCREIHIYPGRFEAVSVSDTTVNNNSFITGHVFTHDGFPMKLSSVSIESLNVNVEPDLSGKYSLLIPPGTYYVKCQGTGNSYKELVLEINDLPAGKNQKTVINFYLGYVAE